MPNRNFQFEAVGRTWTLRFTQRALLDLESAGILPGAFFESVEAPSKLQKALLAGLEGARRKDCPTAQPFVDADAEAILDELGPLQGRLVVGRAFNLANGIPETPESKADTGTAESPKA